MNLGNRIYELRKKHNLSQEELAGLLNVSRQAVSKWESGQSLPEIDKMIVLGDHFDVTLDYLLKGKESQPVNQSESVPYLGKIGYVLGLTLIFVGLLIAIGDWHGHQLIKDVWGAMIIQAVGLGIYSLGGQFSQAQAPSYYHLMSIAGLTFIPISMLTGYLSVTLFSKGWVAPYPVDFTHIFLLAIVWGGVLIFSHQFILKKERKNF